MPPAVFEPTIQAGERPKTNALDRAANWDRHEFNLYTLFKFYCWFIYYLVLTLRGISSLFYFYNFCYYLVFCGFYCDFQFDCVKFYLFFYIFLNLICLLEYFLCFDCLVIIM